MVSDTSEISCDVCEELREEVFPLKYRYKGEETIRAFSVCISCMEIAPMYGVMVTHVGNPLRREI